MYLGKWGSIRLAGSFSFSGIALPSLAADKSAFISVCQPVLLLVTRKMVPCFKSIWSLSLSCLNWFAMRDFNSFVFLLRYPNATNKMQTKCSWLFSILYLHYTLYNSFSYMLNCYRHQMFFPLESSVVLSWLTGRYFYIRTEFFCHTQRLSLLWNPRLSRGFLYTKKTKPRLRLRFNFGFC